MHRLTTTRPRLRGVGQCVMAGLPSRNWKLAASPGTAILNTKLDHVVDVARVVKKKTLDAFAKETILTGRQISHLLCQHLKINNDMSLVYSINDLVALRWQGDAPGKVARCKSDLERRVDTLGPSIRLPTKRCETCSTSR